MPGTIADERDVSFVLFDLLGVQSLTGSERFGHADRDTLEMLLEEAGRFAEQRLLPLSLASDRVGARFEDGSVRCPPGTGEAYREVVEGGWLTMCEDRALGGQSLPEIIKFAVHEQFLAANFPLMCFVNLTHDAARLIELFGDDEQKARYMVPMYAGKWTGTMALTEPGAGSDVGAIRTRARRAADGNYRLQGQKIYITNGEHDIAANIVHLVLARIDGDPAGTRGLSIFIVPKRRLDADGRPGHGNDVRCLGIEHKMGLHASPTTTLSFGDDDDCHAYLLGRPRDGIRIMFHMMNQSRLEVGLYGLGTASTCYRHALAYARERLQGQGMDGCPGQVPIFNHPDVRRQLMYMKAQTEGTRALLYYCGYAMDRVTVADDSAERQRWLERVDLLIPVAKAHATEKGVELCSLAMQVYGGAGYTCDHPIEQFLRDSRVACIFEGTTGIQGIDFALRKVSMRGGAVFAELLDEMDEAINSARGMPGWAPPAEQLRQTRDALAAIPGVLASGTQTDLLRNRLLAATPFLEAFAELLVGWFLLRSALVVERRIANRGGLPTDRAKRGEAMQHDPQLAHLAGKLDCARFFITNRLPVVDGKIAALAGMDTSACTAADEAF